ncbi:hypothetical protein VNI00_019351 [Paramarasmius palmivorus]|uniref:DUF6535 domain-containing protein n=1 Tax=Paramarasmius palmivorus TaxID=297713 RepID=A0AAW0APV9_9AGAR
MSDNSPDTGAAEGNATEKKPTADESFDILLKKVEKYDEELVKGWRDDIDTLLVFAGLFSAVVTAFLIESYQKLEEDPADQTVALLKQLVSSQHNVSYVPEPIPPFQPNASTIRINCFWLLSLIFSLTSALFGLLCKQWVREFQRDTPTSTPAEALALRQLRRDSFEKWNVPAFLAALPILLEIALILFFVGILDLLWGLHRIPFIISLVAVGLSAGLYFITTLLPTLTIPKDQKYNISRRHFERLSYQFICPYKSPQAWLFYRFVCKILHPLSKFWKSTNYFEWKYKKLAPALRYHIEWPASDWSSFDLRVVRQYDQHVYEQDRFTQEREGRFSLQVYQLRAFEWAVTMFRDSPLMIPPLQNVLGTIPPSVAMSAVLGHWDVALWVDVMRADVELAVADPEGFRRQYVSLLHLPRQTAIPRPVVSQPEGIKFLFKHQNLMTWTGEDNYSIPAALDQMGVQTAGFHFVAPLSVTARLWAHQDAGVRKQSLALLQLYKESWKSCSGVENGIHGRHFDERLAFVRVLAKHINYTDRTSVLITSKQGREFIRFIHHEIITQRLDVYAPLFDRVEWLRAIERIREAGDLPSDYFTPLPNPEDEPPDLPPLPPTRYSLDTQPDVEVDHDSQALGSQDVGEASDGEDTLGIQVVGSTTIANSDRGDNPGSSPVSRRGHITSPEGGGRLEHSDTRADESVDATQGSDSQPLVEAMGASVDIEIVPLKNTDTAFSEQGIHHDTSDPSTSEHTIIRGASEAATSPASSDDTPNRSSSLGIHATGAARDAEADVSPNPVIQPLSTAFSEGQETETEHRALHPPVCAGG